MITRCAAALLVAVAAACTGLTSDAPIAIEVVAPPDTVHVGETLAVNVRVLDRNGDSIPGAAIFLTSFKPDTLGVDTAGQRVFVIAPPAPGTVAQCTLTARSGNIISSPFRITVPAP